jgi:glycosyltransferase involved in cell wall biosynthesis|tara:strand:+ start:24171 stop:25238 length:1068 start_codon:yes stop_codon:yes gene_type:complete
MKIIFWQNIISPHQSFLIRKLAERHEVILAVLEEISEARVKQGWQRPDIGKANIVILKNQLIANELNERHRDAINIFSGIANNNIIGKVFKNVSKSSINTVIVEAGSSLGWQKHFRKLIYTIKAFLYKEKINAIFAMGDLGVEWYHSSGFPKEKIYRFQYFTELPKIETLKKIKIEDTSPVLLFIGQLIDRKNIIQLIKALSNLKNHNWKLNVIGDGPLRPQLEKMIIELDMEDKVILYGNLENNKAMSFLINSDYLVLPSKFDGWGAVINEALSRGVKVITNESCGGSFIVNAIEWGIVYKSNNLDDLQSALFNEIADFKRPSLEERIIKAKQFKENYSRSIVSEFENVLLENV